MLFGAPQPRADECLNRIEKAATTLTTRSSTTARTARRLTAHATSYMTPARTAGCTITAGGIPTRTAGTIGKTGTITATTIVTSSGHSHIAGAGAARGARLARKEISVSPSADSACGDRILN